MCIDNDDKQAWDVRDYRTYFLAERRVQGDWTCANQPTNASKVNLYLPRIVRWPTTSQWNLDWIHLGQLSIIVLLTIPIIDYGKHES